VGDTARHRPVATKLSEYVQSELKARVVCMQKELRTLGACLGCEGCEAHEEGERLGARARQRHALARALCVTRVCTEVGPWGWVWGCCGSVRVRLAVLLPYSCTGRKLLPV
jgi:hypothetical protein